jgi:hypothetical protein
MAWYLVKPRDNFIYSWMEDIGYQKLLAYGPIGRRKPGRPLKRLLDGYSREAETGQLLA